MMLKLSLALVAAHAMGQATESPLVDLLRDLKVVLSRDTDGPVVGANVKGKITPLAPRKPVHPCAEDVRRLRCTDVACLKKSTESLALECAAFLLGSPMPSPAPERRAVSKPTPQPIPHSVGPAGFFTMMSSSSDGGVRRVSGPLSMLQGPSVRIAPSAIMSRPVPLEISSMLQGMLPPEISMMFQGMRQEMAMVQAAAEEEEQEEEQEQAQHPCAREVNACMREMQFNTRPAIEQCLLRHFEQLSPECKCFVHHVTGRSGPAAAPSAPKSVIISEPAVAVRTVSAAPATISIEEPSIKVKMLPPPPPHGHRAMCVLFLFILFLVSFLFVRACIVLLCCRTTARRVVIVPPEHASIKPILITETVQVAQSPEPLKA